MLLHQRKQLCRVVNLDGRKIRPLRHAAKRGEQAVCLAVDVRGNRDAAMVFAQLRRFVEPLITLAKKPTLANHRLAFARLRDREIVLKLFNEIGPRVQNRPGGYTRVLKFGYRDGDNAPMAIIELVDRAGAEAQPAQNAG